MTSEGAGRAREVTFNGPLGAATDAQRGELGPPGQMAGYDVGRPSLHNNPTGHGAAGLVTASPQQLLYTHEESSTPSESKNSVYCELAWKARIILFWLSHCSKIICFKFRTDATEDP